MYIEDKKPTTKVILKPISQAVSPYLSLDLVSSFRLWYVDSRASLKLWLIDCPAGYVPLSSYSPNSTEKEFLQFWKGKGYTIAVLCLLDLTVYEYHCIDFDG